MAAHIDIEFFAIYASKKELETAFDECKQFRKQEGFISMQENDFFQLNDNYLLFNVENVNVTYSDSNFLQAYLSILMTHSVFSQYVLKSDELAIDEIISHRKDENKSVHSIKSSHQNSINFTNYFRAAESRKTFQNNKRETITIDTKLIAIENSEYLYFDVSERILLYDNLPLDDLLFSIEDSNVFVTFEAYKKRVIANKELKNVCKELFVSDDTSAENRTYFYGEYDNRIFCVEYQGKETVVIGDETYEDCIKLKHGVLYWTNTEEMKQQGIAADENWRNNYMHTYWAKNKGLVRILFEKNALREETIAYDCITIADILEEVEEPVKKSIEKEAPKKAWWKFWK